MQPNLGKLSTRSLGKNSKSLAKGSTGLAKSSIISIAKKSLYSTSADGQATLTVYSDDELPWHAIPDASIIVDELVSSPTTGLATAEAARRLQDFGPNSLTPAPKPGFLARLWNQLNNILIYILIASAVVKGALQSWPAFGLVLAVVVINTAMGMFQEGRAEKAAEAIKAMLSSSALVLRDGEQKSIPAEELVPGDIVIIKSGDKVPADLRLIEANNLQVRS
jgi:magnesium-transporting ATPase (P-type)